MSTNANTLDNLSFDKLVPSESKYLKRSDVGEDGLIVTISGFKYETLKTDDGDEDKVIVYFKELEKGMVLNKTNSNLIPVITGARTAGEARGKQVVVYDDPTVSYGGRAVGGLRLKKVPGAPRSAPAAASAAQPFNDPIPFLACEYRSIA